jgi:hypothetical protein
LTDPVVGQGLVLALHAPSAPLEAQAIAARLAAALPALADRAIAPILHAVARDGSRWLGVFAAPDAEEVGSACAGLELPASVCSVRLRLPAP